MKRIIALVSVVFLLVQGNCVYALRPGGPQGANPEGSGGIHGDLPVLYFQTGKEDYGKT